MLRHLENADNKTLSAKPSQFLRFREWSPLTWTLCIGWLLLAAWGNTPFLQPHPRTNPQYDLRGYWVDSTKVNQPAYEFTALIGWPMTFLQIEKPKGRIAKLDLFSLVVNIFLAAWATWSLVFLSQRFLGRFSLRLVFVGTAVIAMLLAASPYLLPDWGLIVFINTMLAIFLSPLFLNMLVVVYSVVRRKSASLRNAN